MGSWTQDSRMMAIETPLGKDHLLLRSFTGREGVSQLFTFELDLLSEDSAIQFTDIVGKPVTIRLTLANEKERYFNGCISKFAQIGCDTGLTTYKATMVPWLWFLTQTTDCRIFQKQSVPDIVQKIFKEYGFTDVKLQLQGTYEPREYCVQYRESDYNFVARLLEQYGIFYYFEHKKDKHILVLGDNPSVHQPCPEKAKAHCQLPGGGAPPEEDVLTSLTMEQSFRPGKCALSGYYFETPSTSLLSEVATTLKIGGNEKFELYDYPGEYDKKAEGEALAKLRIEEQEAQQLIVTGTSNCRAFTSGYKFELTDYGRKDMNKAYLLTEVQHIASLGESYTSGATGGGTEDYTNSFTCIPHAVPYRPLRVTPKPLIHGTQTARVVGAPGEIIWCDKYGRIKVQFFWDREGKWNEDSSCWVGVSQNWGGKGWGGVFVPHAGQEVIISFKEGDPDRPMVTGRVYNAEVMPPLELPAQATKSAIRDHNGNEMIMEGKDGEQFIHFKQANGNEIKMDAKEEFILLKQAYGNEIKMDAKAKTIRLYCPNHESEMVMGKSIKLSTTSDLTHFIEGDNDEVIQGWRHTNVIGARTEITVGTKTELNIVNKSTFTGGWVVNKKSPGEKEKIPVSKLMTDKKNEWIKEQMTNVDELKQKSQKYTLEAKNHILRAMTLKGSAKTMRLEAANEAKLKAANFQVEADKLKQDIQGTASILATVIKLC